MKSKGLIKRMRRAAAKDRKRKNTNEGLWRIHSFALQSVSLLSDGSYGISISAIETKRVDRITATITFDAIK